jgi:hypothetical protein
MYSHLKGWIMKESGGGLKARTITITAGVIRKRMGGKITVHDRPEKWWRSLVFKL